MAVGERGKRSSVLCPRKWELINEKIELDGWHCHEEEVERGKFRGGGGGILKDS